MDDKYLLLLDANKILVSTLDIKKLLTVIIEYAGKVVNAEAVSLLLIDEITGELYFDVTIGEKSDNMKTIRLKKGEGVAGWCASYNRSLIVEDVTKDSRWNTRSDNSSGFKTKSIICTPMRCRNKVLGVIEGINSLGKEFFTDDDLPFFEAFANQAAIALENAKLFARLSQEKEKITAAFNGMAEAVFVTDQNGLITQLNKAACNLINSENAIGESLEQLIKNSGLDIQSGFFKFEDKTKTFEIAGKKEKKEYFSCLITKIFTQENIVNNYIFVIRDISEEKKEEFLKRSFLSLISHKLKTPLVAIVGYIPLILNEELSAAQKKGMESIRKQSNRLVSLVEELLKFTMVMSETLELGKTEIKVSEIVSETVKSLDEKFKISNVSIEISDMSELGKIFADKVKMKDALSCIIENAVKFNTNEKKFVKISGEISGKNVILNIEDNGVGIPISEKDKIFEKFYQIEESFTGQVDGAGLGLPLVKRIIEAHGGSIDVTSQIGKFTKFIITIPRAAS
ncbi:MAG: hypothetical protein A2539_08235 [Elusimicrobia bacterium RIFOXYD2_FULL_34_15]|nr:MAG: hypothetical protein A2539_08235 [Elusimicrobia bacterium RIFOXYD2_FULL_34_15]